MKYADVASSLYSYLFPFETPLPSKITIIPDGVLNDIPFGTLVTETMPRGTAYDDLPYALHNYTFSYAPSWGGLWGMQQRKSNGTKKLVAFGPAFYKSDSIKKMPLLNPFKYTGEELRAIERRWPGAQIYTNSYATKKRFKQEAEYYKIIHLSTHGISNKEDVDSSFIAFTSIDGYPYTPMYYQEVALQSLNADLVYLSACETGLGEFYAGEGVFSIARAFITAGSKSVVMTPWSVDERATLEITMQFYQNLKAGLPKDIALSKAKQLYINETKQVDSAHPYFWAGLMPIGDMSPVDIAPALFPSSAWLWLLALIGAIFLLLAVYRYIKR
ncbi:MAG: CHAT domain-containing protein [Cyanobacteria bacterium J06649_11]